MRPKLLWSGESYVGPMGKVHPCFEVTLIGIRTTRTRCFRFRVFRDYYQRAVAPAGLAIVAPFPKTVSGAGRGLSFRPLPLNQLHLNKLAARQVYARFLHVRERGVRPLR